MRMGKKMRILSILMSIAVVAATLGFATFALTQNSADARYIGSISIIGNADIDVKIEFIEITTVGEVSKFVITADENGVFENGIQKVTAEGAAELVDYAIESRPVLNPARDYKFVITVSNPSPEDGGESFITVALTQLAFTAVESGFADYYTVTNPNIGTGDLIASGDSSVQVITLTANEYNALLEYDDVNFVYDVDIVVNKV